MHEEIGFPTNTEGDVIVSNPPIFKEERSYDKVKRTQYGVYYDMSEFND